MTNVDPGKLFDPELSGREWFHKANQSILELEEQIEGFVASGEMPREIADDLYFLIDTLINGFRPKSTVVDRVNAKAVRDGISVMIEEFKKKADEGGDVSNARQ